MREFNRIEGWMTNEEMRWLYNTAKNMKSVAEVGSWKGKSTHALLCGCPGKVYAIDHWLGSQFERENAHKEATERDIFEDFMANVGMFNNLVPIRKESLEAVKDFKDKSVDMVFIDAGHTYEEVKADIEAWLPKAKKILCGHDYGWEGINRATSELLGKVGTAGSIWIKEIK